MSVRYEEFEAAELKKARDELKTYAAQRRGSVEEQIRQVAEAAAGERQAQRATAQAKKQAERQAYTAQYAQNALQGAVTRRAWQKTLSDMGLAQSGLSKAAGQKATAETRAADRAVTTEQQAAVDALMQKLAEGLANSKASQQENEAKLRAAVEKEIAQHETVLIKAAKTRATSQYKAALAAAAKGVATT